MTDRDLIALIIIGGLTALIVAIEVITAFSPKAGDRVLDAAVVFGALWFVYRMGRNGGS